MAHPITNLLDELNILYIRKKNIEMLQNLIIGKEQIIIPIISDELKRLLNALMTDNYYHFNLYFKYNNLHNDLYNNNIISENKLNIFKEVSSDKFYILKFYSIINDNDKKLISKYVNEIKDKDLLNIFKNLVKQINDKNLLMELKKLIKQKKKKKKILAL